MVVPRISSERNLRFTNRKELKHGRGRNMSRILNKKEGKKIQEERNKK
jgi:hypothetical protein